MAGRSGLCYAEQLSHLVVQKALAGLVGLNPLAVENELRNRALAGVGDNLLCSAWRRFDIDLGVGNCVLGQKALGFATIAAPVG